MLLEPDCDLNPELCKNSDISINPSETEDGTNKTVIVISVASAAFVLMVIGAFVGCAVKRKENKIRDELVNDLGGINHTVAPLQFPMSQHVQPQLQAKMLPQFSNQQQTFNKQNTTTTLQGTGQILRQPNQFAVQFDQDEPQEPFQPQDEQLQEQPEDLPEDLLEDQPEEQSDNQPDYISERSLRRSALEAPPKYQQPQDIVEMQEKVKPITLETQQQPVKTNQNFSQTLADVKRADEPGSIFQNELARYQSDPRRVGVKRRGRGSLTESLADTIEVVVDRKETVKAGDSATKGLQFKYKYLGRPGDYENVHPRCGEGEITNQSMFDIVMIRLSLIHNDFVLKSKYLSGLPFGFKHDVMIEKQQNESDDFIPDETESYESRT